MGVVDQDYDQTALLGLAVANALTVLDSSVLVVGGGVFARAPSLKERTSRAIARLVNTPTQRALQIVPAAFDDDAGLIGAALYARESTP